MNHPSEANLIAFARRQLDPAASALMEHHLASCPKCRKDLAEFQVLWEALRPWTPPPPTDVTSRLNEILDQEEHWDRRRFWSFSFVVRAAAAVLIAIGLGHWAARQFMSPPLPVPPVNDIVVAESLRLDALDGEDRGLLAMVDDSALGDLEGGAQ